MSDTDRKARVEELRRQVQSGEYQVDPKEVASSIIRDSEEPQKKNPNTHSKTATTGE